MRVRYRPRFSGLRSFFFNDTATTEIYTLSLHDALPISDGRPSQPPGPHCSQATGPGHRAVPARLSAARCRSEEHTSELQSLAYLVCRLLLEKKKRLPSLVRISSVALEVGLRVSLPVAKA